MPVHLTRIPVSDSLISSAEVAEDCVAKFISLPVSDSLISSAEVAEDCVANKVGKRPVNMSIDQASGQYWF